MQVGDRVKFSRTFLRNTGQVTGDTPHVRGTVTNVKKLGSVNLVTFLDDNGTELKAVEGNLAMEKDPEFASI